MPRLATFAATSLGLLSACQDLRTNEQKCLDHRTEACFAAMMEATTRADRHVMEDIGGSAGDPTCLMSFRDVRVPPGEPIRFRRIPLSFWTTTARCAVVGAVVGVFVVIIGGRNGDR